MKTDKIKTIHSDAYKLLVLELKEERKKQGIMQEELAIKLNVNNKWLSRLENFERRADVLEIWDICEALNIDFVDVMRKFSERLNKNKGY